MPQGLSVSVAVDLTKLEAWIERARTASNTVGKELSKSTKSLRAGLMEDFREKLPSFMEEVGLGQRSGSMARDTTVKVLRVTETADGSVVVLRVEGPPYIMIHETGGIIEPKGKQYLKVPFVSDREGGRGSMLADTSRGQRVARSGAGYFVMHKGKGGKQLRFPLLMERFPAAEGRGNSKRDQLRRDYRQHLQNLRQRSKGMQSGELAAAREVLKKEYEESLKDLPAEAFPVASLRKQVTLPRRPWLSKVVQHFRSKMEGSVEGVEVSYLSNRFDFNMKWDEK